MLAPDSQPAPEKKPTRKEAIDQRLGEIFDSYDFSSEVMQLWRERYEYALNSGEWITVQKFVERQGDIETEKFKIVVPW